MVDNLITPFGEAFPEYAIKERVPGERVDIEVYEAEDERSRRTQLVCSVPEPLRPELPSDAQFLRRLARLRSIQHPSMAPVLDGGIRGRVRWIAVQAMPRGTHSLRDLLNQGVNATLMFPVVALVSRLLAEAAKVRIYHGDLCPEIIALPPATEDADETPCVLELGFAQLFGERHDRLPTYRSPEQILGQAISEQSDMYSLGMIMYEGVAGRPAFSQQDGSLPDPATVALRHLEAGPPPLKAVMKACPAGLSTFVERLLEQKPGDRFANYQALLDASEDAARGLSAWQDVHERLGALGPLAREIKQRVTRSPYTGPSSGHRYSQLFKIGMSGLAPSAPQAPQSDPGAPSEPGTEASGLDAKDLRLDSKVMQLGMASQVANMTRDEAPTAHQARVDRHFPVECPPDAMFISDIVAGRTCSSSALEALQEGLTVSPETRCWMVMCVAASIAMTIGPLAARGVVHGRLDPRTTLVIQANGLALVLDRGPFEQGPAGTSIGAPDVLDFRSPEQRAGKEPDQRSDIYSLGAIMYWMLVGRAPSGAPSATLVESLGPSVEALSLVVEQAIEHEPANRFQSWDAFLRPLLPILNAAKALAEAEEEDDDDCDDDSTSEQTHQAGPAPASQLRTGALPNGAPSGICSRPMEFCADTDPCNPPVLDECTDESAPFAAPTPRLPVAPLWMRELSPSPTVEASALPNTPAPELTDVAHGPVPNSARAPAPTQREPTTPAPRAEAGEAPQVTETPGPADGATTPKPAAVARTTPAARTSSDTQRRRTWSTIATLAFSALIALVVRGREAMSPPALARPVVPHFIFVSPAAPSPPSDRGEPVDTTVDTTKEARDNAQGARSPSTALRTSSETHTPKRCPDWLENKLDPGEK